MSVAERPGLLTRMPGCCALTIFLVKVDVALLGPRRHLVRRLCRLLDDEAVSGYIMTEWSYGAELTSTSQMPALKVMIGTIDMAVVVGVSRSGKGWGGAEYLVRFQDGRGDPVLFSC